jgi:hypothetical protein
LIPLALRWSTSSLGTGLLWLFISGITIEIATYLLSRELEVDLSRFDVDDRVGGVEERPSKDDRYVFFFSHVKDHEIGRDIVILYSYHDIFLLFSLKIRLIGPPSAIAYM